MIKWIKKIFRGKKKEFIEFPKNSSWMINSDLSPNIKNLEKCKEFAALKGVKQSSKWHKEGDVWKHTILVAKKMHKILSDSSCFLNGRNKRVLMLAAICHDLGKAVTTYFDEKENDWKCKNHGYVGEKITRNLLYDEDVYFREEVCWLVRWHMSPHHILDKSYNEQYKEIVRLSQGYTTIENLLLLNLVDSRGSKSDGNTEDKILERIGKIANLAISNDCYTKPRKCYKKPTDCKMYVVIGLPGSGKDTYIKKFFKDIPCITRDDIREEVKDGQVLGRKLMLDQQGEKAVTNIVNDRIKNCCERKLDFVINQTSLKRKYRESFKEIASKYANVEVIYIYINPPSVQECINRRGGGKWAAIINKMWDGIEFPDKSECDRLVMYNS